MLSSPRILFEVEDDRSTSAIAVGSITGSGSSQICTGDRDGVLKLYEVINGETKFLAQKDLEGSILSAKVSDANNDGFMEIVVGRSLGPQDVEGEAGTVQVYRYAPSGQLELLAEKAVGTFVTAVYVTDVTGDNKNEILVGASDSTLRIYKMDTDNNLTEYLKHQLEDMPIAIGTCDVIGDEIDEIVTGNLDKTLRVFKVRNHSIEQIEVLNLPSPVISVAAGDVLGDRKMELGVVTRDGSVRVYRNEESKLDLFTKLENVKALSVRIEEVNADHMDELIIATSDHKVVVYNLQMAEFQQIASMDLDMKILSISVGDANRDDRKEILVGVSDGPLKAFQGLYQIIPKFEVSTEVKTSADLTGRLTLVNVSDQPIHGITGKLYWFPKDYLDVTPEQIRFDLGPGETKCLELQLAPKSEGSVIIRPIVLMWTDATGQVKQVTTPETAILVEEGAVIAAPAAEPSVMMQSSVEFTPTETIIEEESPFTPVSGTGFGEVTRQKAAEILRTTASDDSSESLKAAEELLDQLFGIEEEGTQALSEFDDVSAMIEESAAEVTPIPVVDETTAESLLVTEIRSRTPKPPRPGTPSDTYTYLFKVMVTGEGAVGKTTLVNRYVTGVFERDYKTTIGSQFAVKLAHISPSETDYAVGIKLQAWDVAGQARFKAVRKMYYSGAAGVILVFDVTRRRSFTELSKWVTEADESVGTRVPMIVVGNKIDLPDRAVPSDEAKRWAEDQGFLYMESSAKTGDGVADMFHVLSELMWREARRATEAKKMKSD
ncbi:MAG: GTP-binding protein [Candidatus Thorarchaeota archaeon]|nr:GTP-binding protein [Candidatus Thorarchaeota archaeon]